MCTAISIHGARHLFGRTLDLDRSYGEIVMLLPEKFPLTFRYEPSMLVHPVILGIGCMRAGIPLYYDAANASGLAAAALRFPDEAMYHSVRSGLRSVTSYELIPWLLSHCATLSDAVTLLRKTNITAGNFSDDLPASPLHWMISDKTGSLVVESTERGLEIHENPVGVLTNSPAFEKQLANLDKYRPLCPEPGEKAKLPGGFDSTSRFVRGAFAAENIRTEGNAISRFFHAMETVTVPEGCSLSHEGTRMYTRYTVCSDTDAGICYFTTDACRRIHAVRMEDAPADGETPILHLLPEEEDIRLLQK